MLGGVLIFEGCSEDYLYLFLFSIIDTFILVRRSCDHYWHTLYLSSLYVDICFFHLLLHVLFIFSLYAHASYYLYAIYYFCFTQRCLDEVCLKCFRNTGCQSLLAINSHLAKFFKSLCIGYILLYSTSEYELSDLWLLSYVHLFVVVLSRIAKGGDC